MASRIIREATSGQFSHAAMVVSDIAWIEAIATTGVVYRMPTSERASLEDADDFAVLRHPIMDLLSSETGAELAKRLDSTSQELVGMPYSRLPRLAELVRHPKASRYTRRYAKLVNTSAGIATRLYRPKWFDNVYHVRRHPRHSSERRVIKKWFWPQYKNARGYYCSELVALLLYAHGLPFWNASKNIRAGCSPSELANRALSMLDDVTPAVRIDRGESSATPGILRQSFPAKVVALPNPNVAHRDSMRHAVMALQTEQMRLSCILRVGTDAADCIRKEPRSEHLTAVRGWAAAVAASLDSPPLERARALWGTNDLWDSWDEPEFVTARASLEKSSEKTLQMIRRLSSALDEVG